MAKYKSQHYVPRGYLAAFTDPETPSGQDPYLWVYDRDREGPYKKSPKKVAAASYYYSFQDDQGEIHHGVEALLSQVESAGLPPLPRLAEGAAPSDLTDEDRSNASFFLAFMGHRTPGFRKHVERQTGDFAELVMRTVASDKEYFDQSFHEAMAKAGLNPDIDSEEVRKDFVEGAVKLTPDPIFSLRMMFELSEPVADSILGFEWRVLETADEPFITSDRPLVLVTTERLPPPFGWGVGWFSPWMEATFPLSPRATLLISQHRPEGRERVRNDRVREANARTAAHADEHVFSSQKIAVERLRPAQGAAWWTPLSNAEHPWVADGSPHGSNGG